MARQWLTILDAAENWAHLRVGIHTRFLRWMTQHQQHLHLKRMDKTANFLFSVAWNTFVVFWRANSCGELSGRKRMLLNFLLSLSGKTHVSQSFHWLVGKKYGRRLTYCQVLLRNLFSWHYSYSLTITTPFLVLETNQHTKQNWHHHLLLDVTNNSLAVHTCQGHFQYEDRFCHVLFSRVKEQGTIA